MRWAAQVARALWLVLWLSLAYFALIPANRAPQALNSMIAGMESGEPGWLAAIDRNAAALVAHQGLAASIVLAAALVIIAVGVYLPAPAAKGTLVLAIVVAAVIWVVGEAFGTILAGGATGSEFRAAAGPAGALLLAGPDRGHGSGAHRSGSGRRHRRDDRQMTPSWILDIFAGLMLVVAAVSVGRLGVAQPWRHGAHRAALADIDVAHLLMAIAMAGMLAASLQTLPNGAWEVIFGVLTVWFAYRVARDFRVSGGRALAGGHCGPHLIHAAAMLYMFLALTAPAAHGSGVSGHGRGCWRDGVPELAAAGVYFRAGADRLRRLGSGPALRPRRHRALQPRGRPRGVGQPGTGERGRGGQLRADRPTSR